MKKDEIVTMHQKYVMPTYNPGLALVEGKGCRVTDADGKEYLDFLAGISVLNVGHCHPVVVKAVQDQVAKLAHVSNIYYNENQPRLAKALSEKSLGGKCFFCNSGAEANECLIKLARLWGSVQNKHEVITMRNSFHGRTLATLTATGQEKVQVGFDPLPTGFVYAQFNDLESCRAAVNEKTAAILLEPIQGEGGIMPATQAFMAGIRALCDEKNILMLCDEVQCGMGRTGNWFAYQNYDVSPDAISTSKALGSGVPIGAVCASPEYSDVLQPGKHATTFGGTPLACAAALATIQVIEDECLLQNTRSVGGYFTEKLVELAGKHPVISTIRGQGLMLAMVCAMPVAELVKRLTAQGLLTLNAGENVVRFLPPLNVTTADVDDAVVRIDQALSALENSAKDE